MTAHELIYFDAAGRAESIRLLFSIAGVEFTDTRIKGQDWPTVKATTPLGFIPVLKIDDVTYSQSVSLARYAAKLAGWYPSDPVEALKVDEACDSLNEVLGMAPKSKDPEELKKLRQEFQAGALTTYLKLVEKRIQDNGGLYVTGKTPTLADLWVEGIKGIYEIGFFDHIDKDFIANTFPGIVATAKAISENEKVKAYRDSVKKE